MNTHGSWRAFALLATMAAVVAAFALLLGSGPTAPSGVEAVGLALQRSVSCSDVYQDIDNDTPLGSAHQAADDILAANSMSRLDVPSQTGGFDADVTLATYLGPDLVPDDEGANVGVIPRDSIPDTMPASIGCSTATANANSAAEKNTFHARMNFANQYADRPSASSRYGTYDPTNLEGGGTCADGLDGDADSGVSGYTLTAVQFDNLDSDCYDFPGTKANTLIFSICLYSEATADWSRTDSFSVITSNTAKSTNFGKAILTIGTAVPATTIDDNGDTVGDRAVNPNECTAGLAFPAVSETTSREITTDETGLAKNSGLTADPDGAGVRDTSDGFADDWDGDGCTDWDELDKQFSGDYPVSVTGPVHGLDPFNPNDCDDNLDSTISIFTTVFHDTSNAGPLTSTQGNGQYFKCIGDVADPKGGGTRTVVFRLGCYSDSPISVVNTSYSDAAGNSTCPPAPTTMCGDGKAGGSPPSSTCRPTAGDCDGPYADIEITAYPVVTTATCSSSPPLNCYNKGTNTLTVGGCFEGFGGTLAGPNVYGSGSFDTRVGAGSFTIRIQIASAADCNDGPPFSSGTDIVGTATFVELKSKKDNAGNPLTAPNHKNSDRDLCSDTQELRSNQAMGGFRDPYNDYDYFNPTKDKLNRVDDILAVVNQYFVDDPAGDIDYASQTDRTAIPGANPWNLGPPNGQQRVDDILASVKQYFHDCAT